MEDLGVADVAGDGLNGAMAGLAHDVEDGGTVAGGLGREARTERVPRKPLRIEARTRDRPLDDRADRIRVKRGHASPAMAVDGAEKRSTSDPGGREPGLECGDRAGRGMTAARNRDLPPPFPADRSSSAGG